MQGAPRFQGPKRCPTRFHQIHRCTPTVHRCCSSSTVHTAQCCYVHACCHQIQIISRVSAAGLSLSSRLEPQQRACCWLRRSFPASSSTWNTCTSPLEEGAARRSRWPMGVAGRSASTCHTSFTCTPHACSTTHRGSDLTAVKITMHTACMRAGSTSALCRTRHLLTA